MPHPQELQHYCITATFLPETEKLININSHFPPLFPLNITNPEKMTIVIYMYAINHY